MLKKDPSVIPKGDYCYTTTSEMVEYTREDGQKIKVPKTIPCPYWSLREDKPEQENGYCSYLDEGDWITNEGLEVFDPKTGKTSEVEIPIGLLWDQVKNCTINLWTDEEWEEMYGRGEVIRVESEKEITIPEDCPIIRKKQK